MPIRPEKAALYPPDWPAIRAEVLARARNCCEQCWIRNHALGGYTEDGQWLPAFPIGEKSLRLEFPKPGTHAFCGDGSLTPGNEYVGEELRIIRIVLTIAHIDHDPANNGTPGNRPNLRALCQRCHLAHDRDLHQFNARATRRQRKAVADLFD